MWKDIRKCLAIGSLVIGGIASGLSDPYSKVAFAIALGLSNAAIYIKAEEVVQLGRGKHLATIARKEAKKLIAIGVAEKVAGKEVEREFYKKHPKDWLFEQLRLMLERIDPVKAGIMVITTILVYRTLKGAEGFVDSLTTKVPLVEVGKDAFGSALRNIFGTTFFATAEDIANENKSHMSFNLGEGFLFVTPEMLLSVLIAYLLVYETRATAEAMKAIGGGLVGFAKSLSGI